MFMTRELASPYLSLPHSICAAPMVMDRASVSPLLARWATPSSVTGFAVGSGKPFGYSWRN